LATHNCHAADLHVRPACMHYVRVYCNICNIRRLLLHPSPIPAYRAVWVSQLLSVAEAVTI
jgi:hypothetical protein